MMAASVLSSLGMVDCLRRLMALTAYLSAHIRRNPLYECCIQRFWAVLKKPAGRNAPAGYPVQVPSPTAQQEVPDAYLRHAHHADPRRGPDDQEQPRPHP